MCVVGSPGRSLFPPQEYGTYDVNAAALELGKTLEMAGMKGGSGTMSRRPAEAPPTSAEDPTAPLFVPTLDEPPPPLSAPEDNLLAADGIVVSNSADEIPDDDFDRHFNVTPHNTI